MSEYKADPFEWTATDNVIGFAVAGIAAVIAVLNGTDVTDIAWIAPLWGIAAKLAAWEVVRRERRRSAKRAARERFIDDWASEKPRQRGI